MIDLRLTEPQPSGVTGNVCALDHLTQLLQLDDTLPTLAADPDTIRDAIKAVGEDTEETVEQQP